MEIVKIILSLIGGLGILSYGANFFVDSASRIARNLGVSPLIIGLTIVSIGTSAPEFAVNVMAALQGKNDIALGNVVGSNIFNIAAILGLCTAISPLIISQQLLKLDIPIMLATAALTWWMGHDGVMSFIESLILILLFVIYLFIQLKLGKKESKEVESQYQEAFGKSGNRPLEFIKLIVGLTLLVVGAHLFVDGAVMGARLLGLSEAVIALTIISAGTSIPELATSVIATYKGEKDIAVGNVVGSNIFNILGVLGASGILSAQGLIVNEHMRTIDIPLMITLSGICLPLAFWRQKFDRWLGPFFLLTYGVYIWYLLAR